MSQTRARFVQQEDTRIGPPAVVIRPNLLRGNPSVVPVLIVRPILSDKRCAPGQARPHSRGAGGGMHRIARHSAALGLGIALLTASWCAASVALAHHDDREGEQAAREQGSPPNPD